MKKDKKELDKLENLLICFIKTIDEKITDDIAINMLTNIGMHRLEKSLEEKRFKL